MELAFANCTTVHFSKRSIWVQALIIGSTTMHLKNIFGSNHSPNMSFIHEREEFSNVAWLATKNLTWTERVHSCSKTGSEVVISWGPLCSLINGHLEVPNATSGCDNCKMCWPVRLGIYSSAINT